MKISTKGRYGLIAIMDMAIFSKSDIVTLKSISERQNISERYLEQIFSALKKGGIVKAKKGPQGGYYLDEETYEFTIYDILKVLEGNLEVVNIEEKTNEMESFLCDNLWGNVNSIFYKYFNSIKLENLVKDYKEKKNEIMYYI